MVNFNLNKTKSILFLEQISRNASNSRQILQNLVKGFTLRSKIICHKSVF